jgi:beta-galactosidase
MTIWFGGDYNPEQWNESVWQEDVQLMTDAGVNMVTVGVFSWSMLEPKEGEFTFDWLDRALDLLHSAGIRVDLATSTASPPPWLTHTYPEVLPVTESGVRLQVGSRQQYCPSSPVYRRLATRLATKIVERYADHPSLEMWHINNEYGCHLSHCYCQVSAGAFRSWLRTRHGTIEQLNEAWGTAFWSQRYDAFDEVYPPSAAPYFRNPGQLLDFDRFCSDELLECFRAETAVVRAASPTVPITTNFMGFFKPVNYWKWAKEVDVISDDSYPDPADPNAPMLAAMSRDLMRSLAGGKPWIVMEQAAAAVNWREVNAPKTAGMMRAWSIQAVARGADGILFFQWRQSDRGSERFHSAMLPHSGTESRSWKQVRALGSELAQLGSCELGTVRASVAFVMDWDSWWSIEQPDLPAELSYVGLLSSWYRPFWERGTLVDFVQPGADLSSYTTVVAPALFATSSETLRWLAEAAEHRSLIVSFQTGITDLTGRLTSGEYLGSLATALGIEVEEFHPRAVSDGPVAVVKAGDGQLGTGTLWAERIRLRGAESVLNFAGGDLDGQPAVTRRATRDGEAWYFATLPDAVLAEQLLDEIIAFDFDRIPITDGVEAIRRGDRVFVINHSAETRQIDVRFFRIGDSGGDVITLAPQEVLALSGSTVSHPIGMEASETNSAIS